MTVKKFTTHMTTSFISSSEDQPHIFFQQQHRNEQAPEQNLNTVTRSPTIGISAGKCICGIFFFMLCEMFADGEACEIRISSLCCVNLWEKCCWLPNESVCMGKLPDECCLVGVRIDWCFIVWIGIFFNFRFNICVFKFY